eukprot:Rmarinus@m.20040
MANPGTNKKKKEAKKGLLSLFRKDKEDKPRKPHLDVERRVKLEPEPAESPVDDLTTSDEEYKGPICPVDVVDAAIYLGIDLKGEVYLYWIAKALLDEPLPEGWTERVDRNGEVVFIEARSNRRTHSHPLYAHFRKLLHMERLRLKTAVTTSSVWMEFVQDGVSYYYNFDSIFESGQTTSVRPVSAPVQDEALIAELRMAKADQLLHFCASLIQRVWRAHRNLPPPTETPMWERPMQLDQVAGIVLSEAMIDEDVWDEGSVQRYKELCMETRQLRNENNELRQRFRSLDAEVERRVQEEVSAARAGKEGSGSVA